jgi:hypothetical protein
MAASIGRRKTPATLAAVRPLAVILAAVALATAACSSGSDSSAGQEPGPAQDTTPMSTPAQHFTKDQLPKLALQPSDAPEGMRYSRKESGRMSLSQVGFVLDSQIKPLRVLKLKGIYDATFDSTSRRSDLRLASRLWLFDDADSAQKWLNKTERDSQQYAFESLAPPKLGDDAWAGYGNLAAQVLTYAFRKDNVVVVTSYTTQTEELSQAAAVAAAEKAAQRLEKT